MKDDAERALNEPVREAVITVPAYFTDARREATRDAGILAGLVVERIINEPTAAALAYGLDRLDQEAHVLVYDLGGGTFDVSVLEMFDGVLDVKASSGNARLGGADFDAAVAQWLADRVFELHRIDVSGDPKAEAQLKLAAEAAKIALTDRRTTQVTVTLSGRTVDVELDRPTFERLVTPLVRATLEPVASALRDAKLEPRRIDEILLIGGSSRVPLVQRMIEEFFGKPARFEVNPDEAVALGAAVQAGLKAGALAGSTGILLTDVAPFTLGVEAARTVGSTLITGFFTPIIHRNSTVPVTRSQVFSTVADGQTAVKVRVYQSTTEADVVLVAEDRDDGVGYALAAVDVDADGDRELVVGANNSDRGGPTYSGRVSPTRPRSSTVRPPTITSACASAPPETWTGTAWPTSSSGRAAPRRPGRRAPTSSTARSRRGTSRSMTPTCSSVAPTARTPAARWAAAETSTTTDWTTSW